MCQGEIVFFAILENGTGRSLCKWAQPNRRVFGKVGGFVISLVVQTGCKLPS